jgi:hypothetical protein
MAPHFIHACRIPGRVPVSLCLADLSSAEGHGDRGHGNDQGNGKHSPLRGAQALGGLCKRQEPKGLAQLLLRRSTAYLCAPPLLSNLRKRLKWAARPTRKQHSCTPQGHGKEQSVGESMFCGLTLCFAAQPALGQMMPAPPGYRQTHMGGDAALVQ